MKDLSGFVILVLISVLLLYLMLEFVLPFLLTYILGTLAFFVTAGLLLRRGRKHPIHLECLLKPGIPWILTAMAISIPAAHAALVWLFTGHEGWPFIAGGNALFPILWTGRLLLAHNRQKAMYTAQGHDIEDLLAEIQSRGTALGIKAMAVESAMAIPHAQEPWETAAGLMTCADMAVRPDTPNLLQRMASLRASYARLFDSVAEALAAIRSGSMRPPHPVLAMAREELLRLEEPYLNSSNEAREIVMDSLSGVDIGWDDPR